MNDMEQERRIDPAMINGRLKPGRMGGERAIERLPRTRGPASQVVRSTFKFKVADGRLLLPESLNVSVSAFQSVSVFSKIVQVGRVGGEVGRPML